MPTSAGLGAALEALLQRCWWQPRRTALAQLLRPLSWLYAALAGLHRAPYRWGWRRAERAPVPLVVVGNLIAGGAGKTPTVIAVVEMLRAAGRRPGVVSRGYGRREDENGNGNGVLEVTAEAAATKVGDEPLLIARRTGVPVFVARQRIKAARALCAAHPDVDVLVSDDGLQHHALARDAALIVFDERGIGNGLRLPAGPLREALPARLPPSTLLLYNAAAATTRLPGELATRRLGLAVPLSDWLAGRQGAGVPLSTLAGRPLLAVAGMAAPERFFNMLEAAGLTIDRLPLPDHHDYDTLPWPDGTAELVTTEKDAVKLAPARMGATRVWVVGLDFRIPDHLARQLLRCLEAKSPP
jgi:tetraacyldisaccharide 4'-kinase